MEEDGEEGYYASEGLSYRDSHNNEAGIYTLMMISYSVALLSFKSSDSKETETSVCSVHTQGFQAIHMKNNNRNITKVSYSQSMLVACVWYMIAFDFHHPAECV